MNSSPFRLNWKTVSLVFAVVISSGVAVLAQPSYQAINLGTLGGSNSLAHSINNRGQVVGSAFISSSTINHATLFSGNGLGTGNIDLGNLVGNVNVYSEAFAINDAMQIVGIANAPSGFNRPTLFSGTGSGNLDLGSIGGTAGGRATAINNSGQIAGSASSLFNATWATLFSGTGSGNTNLGTLGGAESIVNAINNSGMMVGQANDAFARQRATVYSGTGSNNVDLGTLVPGNAGRSGAYGVNDAGQIVGSADIDALGSATHATVFSGTGSGNTDLGTLGGTTSLALSINNSGWIVGNSHTGSGNAGFVFTAGTMYDLNLITIGASSILIAPSSTASLGKHINEFGQISATGFVSGQGFRALRLDPIDPLTSVSNDGDCFNTKFVGGMNYDRFTAVTNPDNLGTAVDLLGGEVGSSGPGAFGLNRDVTVCFFPPDPNCPISDLVNVSGTEGDSYVLQLSYDESLANGLLGDEANARLGWLDNGIWVLAVDGNIGGTPLFVMGPWNASYGLGTCGLDTAANTVWGVLNHNSDFAVWGESTNPGPDTEGAINIVGFDFFGFETVNPAPNEVSFLEITYDGVSPIIMNTFFDDANGFDTEIGLYDSAGLLIASNDNANSTLQSRLVLKDLPAGTYYLAAGLFNTTFGATDFNATSNSGIAGFFRVDALTFPENVVAGDVNGDGQVNLLDISPFVSTLVTNGYSPEADVTCDGAVNLLDVTPFVELLSGG